MFSIYHMSRTYRLYAVGAITIVTIFGLTTVAYAAPQTVTLRGQNEVPPVSTDTTGSFRYEFINYDSNRENEDNATNRHNESSALRYRLSVENGRNITAAHIHCGLRGQNGPVIATLYESNNAGQNSNGRDVNGVLAEGTVEDEDINTAMGRNCPNGSVTNMQELKEALIDDELYVNVHNTAYPAGLIRAQLSLDDNNGGGTNEARIRMIIERIIMQLERILSQLDDPRPHSGGGNTGSGYINPDEYREDMNTEENTDNNPNTPTTQAEANGNTANTAAGN